MHTAGKFMGDYTPRSAANGTRSQRRRRFVRPAAAGVVVMLGATLAPGVSASAAPPPTCTGTPMLVTADCVDPLYNQPVIDGQTDLTTPVPLHKVSGHFQGTTKNFNVYLPPKNRWRGRFFQNVYPLQDDNASDVNVSFGAASGAYTVQTNGGGGYRVDAAAAKFAKTVAAGYYRSSRQVFGYIWGGSGGSYQTIGAVENTTGVWDGAVPFIIGLPTSIPNNFFVRAFARFVLLAKAQHIADAVAPGGSGDPYAGLNQVERAVLLEVTKMGVPLRAWEDYPYVLGLNDPQGLLGFAPVVQSIDPTYADDFWGKAGYLGTEQSALGDLFRDARVQVATITQVNQNAQNVPTSVVLNKVPPVSSTTGLATYTLLAPDGTTNLGTLSASLDATTKVLTISTGNDPAVLHAIKPGDKLRIDNSWSLALLVYHRYQVPKEPGFYAWDQFRKPDGTPIPPQRALEIGPLISASVTGGGTFTGNIHAKVIVVGNLIDTDAFPWDGDWYRTRVKQALGARFENNFRLWYNDNADHIENGPRTFRLVQYDGILQQALRDVSAWAERGVAPAKSTRYAVADSQVSVPGNAAARRGIQPVVHLTVNRDHRNDGSGDGQNGDNRIDVAAGQAVTFHADINVPPDTGKIVATEWDFAGNGNFTPSPFGGPKPTVELEATFTYPTPGTYFPALRATSQRDGDTTTPFARVQNLGRVRVVVH